MFRVHFDQYLKAGILKESVKYRSENLILLLFCWTPESHQTGEVDIEVFQG